MKFTTLQRKKKRKKKRKNDRRTNDPQIRILIRTLASATSERTKLGTLPIHRDSPDPTRIHARSFSHFFFYFFFFFILTNDKSWIRGFTPKNRHSTPAKNNSDVISPVTLQQCSAFKSSDGRIS